MSSVVSLNEEAARQLDAGTRGSGASQEPIDSPAARAFATYLHETIHWWQHIGSTAGMLHGLSIPAQTLATTRYLTEVGLKGFKPIIATNPDSYSGDHPAGLAVSRWTEIEFGTALLSSPPRANARFIANRNFYESMGHAILLTQISTMAGLTRILDPGGTGLPKAVEWIPYLRELINSQAPYFVSGQLLDLPLGMEHIMEGQARLSELQYRMLSYQEARDAGLLSGVYGVALENYLTITGFSAPEEFDEASVHLFLLLCDIALNPSTGYPDTIDPGRNCIRDLHPGVRFLRLCHEVKQDPEVLREVEEVGYESYIKASQRLCERLDWLDPVTVSLRCVEIGSRMSGYAELLKQHKACKFGVEDVPIRFYFAQHLDFLKTKTECPHFYCWPGRFLVNTEEQSNEADVFSKLFSRSLPPFVTSSFNSGVTAANLRTGSKASRKKFVNTYFLTLALNDMVRQWISNRGDFRFDFSWKPQMSRAELESLWSQFEKNLDVPHSRISVL